MVLYVLEESIPTIFLFAFSHAVLQKLAKCFTEQNHRGVYWNDVQLQLSSDKKPTREINSTIKWVFFASVCNRSRGKKKQFSMSYIFKRRLTD